MYIHGKKIIQILVFHLGKIIGGTKLVSRGGRGKTGLKFKGGQKGGANKTNISKMGEAIKHFNFAGEYHQPA